MKALAKSKAEKGIWMIDAPKPEVGHNDVLIKIKKTAICGTDLHIYKWDEWAQETIPVPMIIGHEYVGVIEAMGSEVTRHKVGDRVAGEGHIACGYCRNCRRGRKHICDHTKGIGVHRDGAFAEYLVVPHENVLKIDERIPDEIVAIMDPLGNATHMALSFPLIGEDVLITGAGGPIGLMAITIARFAGARYIMGCETSPYRIKLAKKMGADLVINPKEESVLEGMKRLGMVVGFDIGMECSGSSQAFNEMIENMYNGGKIALLGILPSDTTINWVKFIFKGLQLKGIYGREMYETWYHMEMMLLSGLNISSVITHRFHVNEYQKAFEIMEQGNCVKIILDWE